MASWVDINLMASVTRYVQDYILPFVPDDRVMLLTQATLYGTLYRANHHYQSIHKEIGRNDWVNVQWSGSHSIVSGRIIVFVDLPKICLPKACAAIQSDGLYVIICSVEQAYTWSQTKLWQHAKDISTILPTNLPRSCNIFSNMSR